MPLIETKGAASAQGFGGAGAGASGPVTYIEDVFSTYLYTGNGSTQTITNGIDLSGKGGLVWIKGRSNATDHVLYDTTRGATKNLISNSTAAETTQSTGLTAFSGTGFSIGALAELNSNTATYASWTFRKQPKFFDVVTYTGTGSAQNIAHNLGSAPGFLIVKPIDSTGGWTCWHRSLSNSQYMRLNTTAAVATDIGYWNNTAPTSTQFSVGSTSITNGSGITYVAYLFAHDAGGFGLSESDNVISCGSFTANGSGVADVNLGYEPQWILFKPTSLGGSWQLLDTMRGWSVPLSGVPTSAFLYPNTSGAETSLSVADGGLSINATGFGMNANDGNHRDVTFIYIAIRRGPMKVPTSGTSVFGLSARTGTGANATVTGSAGVSDAVLIKNRGSAVGDLFASRLTGTGYLETSSTAAEVAAGTTILQANPWDVMDGVNVGTTSTITNASANTYINYLFDRAPGFFDEVCYTGDGTDNRQVIHNLGVTPEFVIVKPRSVAWQWWVYHTGLGNTRQGIVLNSTAAKSSNVDAFSTNGSPFSSSYFLQSASSAPYPPNASGYTYVAYLFATCAGVSKVGSYTGTGALQTIDCGFTGGARFVLIKRTDSTGDWYVYDSARGISSGNDPYLLLNDSAAEVTGTNYVDTTSVGFQVTAAAPAGLNANGGTYIFLAIA